MNAAIQRMTNAILLLLIFTLALHLRFSGLDWAFKDGSGHSPHPDERHYQSCFDAMHPYWLNETERQLPWSQQWEIFYRKNLHVEPGQRGTPGNPGLRPVNYNYGTFPLHLYLMTRDYVVKNQSGNNTWNFFMFTDLCNVIILLFTLALGFLLYRSVLRDYRQADPNAPPMMQNRKKLQLLVPCLLIPFTGLMLLFFYPHLVVDYSKYNPNTASILLYGRTMTAWAGALTVLLTYLIGRDAYNKTVGLVAALMLTVAMLHIQTSHFATVDGLVGFWTTAALYCFLKISQKPRLIWYLLSTVCIGFAVGTKWSSIILPALLWFAHAIGTWSDERDGKTGRLIHSIWLLLAGLVVAHFFKAASSDTPLFYITLVQFRDFYLGNLLWIGIALSALVAASCAALMIQSAREKRNGFLAIYRVYKPWIWLAIALPAGWFAFLFAEPMAYFDPISFAQDMTQLKKINATGEIPMVFTQQFLSSVPVVTMLNNLFYPSLDYFTAAFVVFGSLYAAFRLLFVRCRSDLFMIAWAIPGFIIYSSLASTFPRYIVPVLPVMIVLGARLMVDMIRIQPHFSLKQMAWVTPAWKQAAKTVGIVGGALAIVCGTIYGWSYIGIYDHPHTLVEAGRIVRENMKPNGKIIMGSWDEGLYGVNIPGDFHIHDNPNADRNAKQRVAYFADVLSRHDYIVFTSKRQYGTTLSLPERYPITNRFLKTLFSEQLGFKIAKVVDNPPQFLGMKFYVDEEDETARIYDHPKVIIFEKVHEFSKEHLTELIKNPPAWVSNLTASDLLDVRDGYPVFQPTANVPILRWWIAIQVLGLLAFLFVYPLCKRLPDGGYAISKTVGIAFFAWLCWFLASNNIVLLSSLSMFIVLIVMIAIALFSYVRNKASLNHFLSNRWPLVLTVEGLFTILWMLFMAIRAYHPAAFWGEKPMNFSFINAVYRTGVFPPEDPWISDHIINYYYYGHAVFSIIGRLAGIPPEYVFNIGGTCVTALVGISIFSLTYAVSRKYIWSFLATYLAVFAGPLISFYQISKGLNAKPDFSITDAILGAGSVIKLMAKALLNAVGLASEGARLQLSGLDYNTMFWQSGHDIFFGTAANEFPYWTHLFLDFHAHMLVIPFTLAFLILLYAFFVKPFREWGGACEFGICGLLAMLLGTVICTNTWDFPGLVIALLLITAVKWFRETEGFWDQFTKCNWLTIEGLHSFLRFPVAPLVLILTLNLLMFYPFHANFQARVTGVGIMTQGQTPITIYLIYWGQLLFPMIVALTLIAITTKKGMLSLMQTIAFAILFMLSLATAIWATYNNPFHFPAPFGGGPPLNYTVFGLFFPFLALLFLMIWNRDLNEKRVFLYLIGILGLGFSLGIELFYIKEGWSIPNHRWNTIFKFNIQVWHYFSIFSAVCIGIAWNKLGELGRHLGSIFTWSTRSVYAVCAALLLLATLPFAVIAPTLVTMTHGAKYRDAKGPLSTLDGLAWLRQEQYDAYAGVKWFNRFVPGTANIVEYSDKPYFQFARFSTNTGLPSLIGWDHHVGERMHQDEKEPRRRALDVIYRSQNKEEVVDLLSQYNIEYLVFGDIEMNARLGRGDRNPPLGKKSLQRFERWGDTFRLLYRFGNQSIFRIDKSLNRIYNIKTDTQYVETEDNVPPALRKKQEGVSMYQGGQGSGNGMFNEPRGIVQDATGRIFIADTRNYRIQVFNSDGSYAWQTGEQGGDDGQFNEPNDITIDPRNGHLYIADTWNHRVVLLDSNGSYLGAAYLGFFGPRGIVFDPDWNMIYVTDTGNHLVRVMSPEGQLLNTWGKPGGGSSDDAMQEPVGIGRMPEGEVIVVDSKNRRLKVYNPKGEVLDLIPIQTSWNGESGFEGHVACAPGRLVYLTDPKERSVQVYNVDSGELIRRFKTDKEGRRFTEPIGIAVLNDGRVIVSDKGEGRIVEIPIL